jgi:hypothetical protein
MDALVNDVDEFGPWAHYGGTIHAHIGSRLKIQLSEEATMNVLKAAIVGLALIQAIHRSAPMSSPTGTSLPWM